MNVAHSPLFEPVLWQGNGFKILDETLIPERVEYIAVSEVAQALEAVRQMKTRAFGQVLTFLYSGALLAESHRGQKAESVRAGIEEMIRQFRAARPTFDFQGLGRRCFDAISELPAGADAADRMAAQARGFAAKIVQARQARARRAAAILPSPARVLTHCNISGELVAVAQHCRESGKEISVIATETRPYLQGTRLTAWELANAGVPVSVIPDCAITQVLASGAVNAVIVGSDRSAQNGDIINKVGTYPLALMAREYGVPFFALVQDPGQLAHGSDVPLEERPVHELLTFQEQPLIAGGADKLAGRYPAFDVTPAALIDHLIGFDDLFTPASFAKKYSTTPPPAAPDRKEVAERYLLVYGVPKKESYAFLAHALKAEQAERILVPEMRPEHWGAQVIAPELLRRDVPATLIADNMMGTLFAQGQIRKLYLFYNELDPIGPRGICGALLAVRLARAHEVAIELLESDGGKDCPADHDVSTFLGKPIMPPRAAVYPLQKEIVPWALLQPKPGAEP